MQRRDFLLGAIAGMSAGLLSPTAAAKSKAAWDELSDQYDQNVVTVFRNNVQQWMHQRREDKFSSAYFRPLGPLKLSNASLKEVQGLANMFSPDFIQDVFAKVQRSTRSSWAGHPLTIEAMNLPAVLLERGDRSLSVVATTRRLRCHYHPTLAQDFASYKLLDAEEEIRTIMADQIANEIRAEMVQAFAHNTSRDEMVFCPYVLPITLPPFLGSEYTHAHRMMMRYALAVFPGKV